MRLRGDLATAGSRVAIIVVAAGLLAGSGAVGAAERIGPRPETVVQSETVVRREAVPTARVLPVPAGVTTPDVGLRAGPVAVPLELSMPTLGVTAQMLGVGILPNNVMDAPTGPMEDPVWDQAFWYRGSAIPGALSTALIAGHIDGPGGRPAVFGQIDRLVAGDPVVVHDTRTGLDVRFTVTSTETYPLDQTTDPVVLTRIYGSGPVAGTWPQPSADRLAHLTLITCAGTFRNGTHDHRLAVYATRTA